MGSGRLQSRRNVFLVLHAPGRYVVGVGQLHVVGAGHGNLFEVAVEKHLLPLANHAQVAVVEQGNLDGQLLLHGGHQFLQRHLETAVAGHRPHRGVGPAHLRAQSGGNLETHGTWQTQEELEAELLKALIAHVDEIEDDRDERGFGASLGGVLSDKGVFFNAAWPEKNRKGSAERCESWQVLSPVRGKGHGVDELNRFLHQRFRARALRYAEGRNSRTPRPNGGQRIVYGDKVMSIVNQRRRALGRGEDLVSNGEIGVVVGQAKFGKKWDGETPRRLDVEYGTQLGTTFVYWPGDFGDDSGVVLELAYALTIHKSQGSQFNQVFVVIPQPCFILGRELIYTALTRQLDRVVLFVQGQPADIRAYASSKYSEVARRYTNLFQAPDMIVDVDGGFLERRLIHRTARRELVRSISEVVVADALHAEGIEYHYEKALRGRDGVERYPDFTAEDPATGVTVYWEHFGMLSDPTYCRRWEKKIAWYENMSLTPDGPENDKGERLVTSRNRLDGAIDSDQIRRQVREVFDL